MALAYVARYATTRAKLLRYLQRKLHERGRQHVHGREPQCAARRQVLARARDNPLGNAAICRLTSNADSPTGWDLTDYNLDELLKAKKVDAKEMVRYGERFFTSAMLALRRKSSYASSSRGLGGVAHGIGNALYEWMAYDKDAQPITTTFADYLLPSAILAAGGRLTGAVKGDVDPLHLPRLQVEDAQAAAFGRGDHQRLGAVVRMQPHRHCESQFRALRSTMAR